MPFLPVMMPGGQFGPVLPPQQVDPSWGFGVPAQQPPGQYVQPPPGNPGPAQVSPPQPPMTPGPAPLPQPSGPAIQAQYVNSPIDRLLQEKIALARQYPIQRNGLL